MLQVFIDESGNHDLNILTLDKQYPVFVLGGVCFPSIEAYYQFDKKLKDMKKELFGSEEFIIHTVDMQRPGKSKDFRNGKFLDAGFRKIFYSKCEEIIDNSNFIYITIVVKKALL